MEIAKIQISGTKATVLQKQTIPAGLIGGYIRIEYTDTLWDNLTKTVVFKGNVIRDIITNDEIVRIPAETIAAAGDRLYVGFYGIDTENTLAIPTFWADLGMVANSTDPSGDESTSPSFPVWAQLEDRVSRLERGGSTGGSYSSVSSVNNVSPDGNGNVSLSAKDIGALPSTGGDMTGPINMNGQTLSGLNAPTADTQAVNKGYADGAVKKAAPRNLLDNSDFRNPVNQRGQMTYRDPGYTIDRWKLDSNGITVSIENGYVKLLPAGQYNLSQNIGDFKHVRGKKVTFALRADGNLNLVIGCYASGTMSFGYCDKYDGLLIGTYIIPENAESVIIFIQPQDTNECRLYWAALYEGEYTAETFPEYQPKGYAEEFMECQRCYVGKIAVIDICVANASIERTIVLPVPMRTIPTVTVRSYNGTEGYVSAWINNMWEERQASVSMLDNRSIRISAYNIDVNAVVQCEITASADL